MSRFKIILISILLASSLALPAGELVKIEGANTTAVGFLAISGGKVFLYTSQSALFGMKFYGVSYKVILTTFSGKKLLLAGKLQISPVADIARVEVNADKKDAFQIGGIKNIGEPVTLFPDPLSKEPGTVQKGKIAGIGIYNFAYSGPIKQPAPGTPVLNSKGEVVGVLSNFSGKFLFAQHKTKSRHKKNGGNNIFTTKSAPSSNKNSKKKKSNNSKPKKNTPVKSSASPHTPPHTTAAFKPNKKGSNKKKSSKKKSSDSGKKTKAIKSKPVAEDSFAFFKYTEFNPYLGARLDTETEWVTALDVDFFIAGDAIAGAQRLQKEFVPLLNWWFTNPYRQIPDDLHYPTEMQRFIQYNNQRTPIIRKLVAEIASKPIDHQAALHKVRDSCLHRAELLKNFPLSHYRNLRLPYKTRFLRITALQYAKNWQFILKKIDTQILNMTYKIPY